MLNSLTPELLSEFNFNSEKEAKARVEAYLQGHLLPEEITPELVDQSTVLLQKIAKAQRERNSKNNNIRSKIAKEQANAPKVSEFAGVHLKKCC